MSHHCDICDTPFDSVAELIVHNCSNHDDQDDVGGLLTDGGTRPVWIVSSNKRNGPVYHTDPDCSQLSESRNIRESERRHHPDKRECKICADGYAGPQSQDFSLNNKLKDADPDDLRADGGVASAESLRECEICERLGIDVYMRDIGGARIYSCETCASDVGGDR